MIWLVSARRGLRVETLPWSSKDTRQRQTQGPVPTPKMRQVRFARTVLSSPAQTAFLLPLSSFRST